MWCLLCNPYLVGAAGRRHPSKVASTLHGYCVRWKGGMWCIWVEMRSNLGCVGCACHEMCDEMCNACLKWWARVVVEKGAKSG